MGLSNALRAALATVLLAAIAASAAAGPPLRVGVSGDYPPFSDLEGERYVGFDADVARAFAADQDADLTFVRFRWPSLVARLRAGEFDVAMSGITVRPERSTAGRFSVAVVETGAFLLVPEKSERQTWHDWNTLGKRVGVNAGGHLARVAERALPRTTVVAIPDNRAVLRALKDGAVDAVLTDGIEGPHWLASLGEGELLGPLTKDRKAYLVAANRSELAVALDAWLIAREADGVLSALRQQHFGKPGPPAAHPAGALFAAVDERLALMPTVGVTKRAGGFPLEVPEREALVIEAGLDAVRAAAAQRQVEPPPAARVRAVYAALIEAAKEVQLAAVRSHDFTESWDGPDLDTELRPALLRIGDRIAHLLLAVPANPPTARVRATARREIRTPQVSEGAIDAVADAVARLWRGEPEDPKPSDPTEAAGQETGDDGKAEATGVAEDGDPESEDRDLPGDESVESQ